MELFDANNGITVFYAVSQVFALASLVFDLVAMQRRRKTTLLNMDVMAAICSFLHYAFLGAWAGMVSKAVTTARNGIAAYSSSKKIKTPKALPLVFIAIYIVIGCFTFKSPLDILPILAPCIYTVVIYMCDITKIRYTGVATAVIWLIYDICVFSIVGVVTKIILIINDSIAIYRFRKKGSKKT